MPISRRVSTDEALSMILKTTDADVTFDGRELLKSVHQTEAEEFDWRLHVQLRPYVHRNVREFSAHGWKVLGGVNVRFVSAFGMRIEMTVFLSNKGVLIAQLPARRVGRRNRPQFLFDTTGLQKSFLHWVTTVWYQSVVRFDGKIHWSRPGDMPKKFFRVRADGHLDIRDDYYTREWKDEREAGYGYGAPPELAELGRFSVSDGEVGDIEDPAQAGEGGSAPDEPV